MWKLLRIWDYFLIVSILLVNVCAVRLESDIQGVGFDPARVRRAASRHALRGHANSDRQPASEVSVLEAAGGNGCRTKIRVYCQRTEASGPLNEQNASAHHPSGAAQERVRRKHQAAGPCTIGKKGEEKILLTSIRPII